MKLLPCILFEKCIRILALEEMASPGNQHCTNCVGARLFLVVREIQRFTRSVRIG